MSTSKENTPADSPSLLISFKNDENAQAEIAERKITKVVWKYLDFLQVIAITIKEIKDDENQKKKEMRKFFAIKKELFDYLLAHKKFYNMNKIYVTAENSSVVCWKKIDIINDGNNFLKLTDVLIIDEIIHESTGRKVGICTESYKIEILDAIRLKRKKSVLTNQDIHQLLENHLLIEKSDFYTKCSTYADLQAYIEQRIEDYCDEQISAENISQMSFKFQGSIEGYEDEKSCTVCLSDYKTDQEVCRLPCNHFCCRVCTEIMFSTPNQGLMSNISCPICRDDCT